MHTRACKSFLLKIFFLKIFFSHSLIIEQNLVDVCHIVWACVRGPKWGLLDPHRNTSLHTRVIVLNLVALGQTISKRTHMSNFFDQRYLP